MDYTAAMPRLFRRPFFLLLASCLGCLWSIGHAQDITDAAALKSGTEWAADLQLADSVPAAINPLDGKRLSDLDRYTIGKVAFTLKGYHAIVPDLTAAEEAVILANLKEARERAIDFKNMKQISAIFEIYKTRNEQFLNNNGRNWKALYSAYVKAAQARKAAENKP